MPNPEKYQIEIEPVPQFIPEQSDPDDSRYVFAYTITLENTGTVPAQLISRHWVITDANSRIQEVRGLGVLNVRHIFGETSIRPKKILQLIINLVPADDEYMKQLDRLSIRTETESILNVNIRSVSLPVAVGRNLAVLVEAAVRNYILQLRGKDSTKEFLERHQTMLKEDEFNHENSAD